MLSQGRILLLSFLLCLLISPFFLDRAGSTPIQRKKLSETELQELEDQWFEDEDDDPEDPTRWRKMPDGSRSPPKPKHKSEMAFVSLRKPITKDETADWGGKQADMLTSGGVDVKAYPVEAGKVLFVADKGFPDMNKVQKFILKQPRVVDFEWNQKKSYPKPEDQRSEEEEEDNDSEADIQLAKIQAVAAGTADLSTLSAPPKAKTKAKAKSTKTTSTKTTSTKKHASAEVSLGGAGGAIPFEIPDDDDE